MKINNLKSLGKAMKKTILFFLLITITFVQAQDVQMAYDYFRKGEYQKAITVYQKLYNKSHNSRTYFRQLVRCYQQLEDFEAAETLIKNQFLEFPKHQYLNVVLGNNYKLQNLSDQAEPLFQLALNSVETNPSSARMTGQTFQNNNLLDYALEVYRKGMELNPKLNFHINIATIYGEQGKIDQMFDTYLDMVRKNPKYFATIQRYVSRFVTDDNESPNNILFRKLVLKRLQDHPNVSWTKLLSWLYMQQKDYDKALVQEKAIFLRSTSDLTRLFELATVSNDEKQFETAKNTYQFITKNTNNQNDILRAQLELLEIETVTAENESDFTDVENKFQELFIEYGKGSSTVKLQVAYADFLTFTKNKPQEALIILKEAVKVANSKYERGDIKIKLADILVYTNKFNQALINYTQVQSDLRGSETAQNARLKVAKTSYYKGDFDWAKTQLKVLKSATSKLISNDALKMNLLIGDNIAGDTLRVALKKYATADLLAYQNKNTQAIDSLNVLLKDHKGHAIEDEALFKQAELYLITKQFAFAENNYQKIIKIKKDGILVDDTLFALGSLYETDLKDLEKAKEMYQKIIFDFASSIHLVEARKRFRKLRGDAHP